MKTKEPVLPLSQIIQQFLDGLASDTDGQISFGQITEGLHERGFGILLLIFSIFCLLPVPGVHSFLSIPLYIITFQMMIMQHKVWMPKIVTEKKMSLQVIREQYTNILPYLAKAEKLVKPRLPELTEHYMLPVIGGVALFTTAMLSLPIPIPGTNLLPSIALILIAVGMFMRDGIALLLGMAIGLAFSFGLLYFFFNLIQKLFV